MAISAQTLETLEFSKILERLARHTSFSASRELALGLLPSTDAYVIRRGIALTSEARRLLDDRPDTSIGGARDIRGWATEDIVRLGVGHVPEGRGTFVNLSVDENLRAASYTRRDKEQVARDLDMVLTYFPILGKRIKQQAGTLSGGEQQMLAISRALMLRPRLMLLDEPSFGLAPLIVQEIFRIMRRINEESKVSMLLVEQNASLALDLADHAYVLETGSVVMSGASAVVKSDEAIRKSYLGY